MGIPLGKVAKENEWAIHKRDKTKERKNSEDAQTY